MKKILTLTLVLFMVVSLTACNKTTPASSSEDNSSNSQVSEGKDNKKAEDLTTVEGFMNAFGITEDDMKCAKFTRIDKTSYDLKIGRAHV